MYRISSEEQREDLHAEYPHQGGVYTLHCLKDTETKTIIPTNSVLGVDAKGVLYIGKTAAGLGRIGDLIKSLFPDYKSKGHHVGLRYEKNKKLRQMFRSRDYV